MALQKQVVGIDFTGGLDKKTDPYLLRPGKLTTMENAIFDSANTISKSGGYAATPVTAFDGSSIATGRHLAKRGAEILIETDDGALHSVASANHVRRTNNFFRT